MLIVFQDENNIKQLTMSILAVLVATLVANFLGFVWYSPTLFGNVWMKHAKIRSPPESSMIYGMTAIAEAVVLMLLQHLLM